MIGFIYAKTLSKIFDEFYNYIKRKIVKSKGEISANQTV